MGLRLGGWAAWAARRHSTAACGLPVARAGLGDELAQVLVCGYNHDVRRAAQLRERHSVGDQVVGLETLHRRLVRRVRRVRLRLRGRRRVRLRMKA